MFRKYIWFLAFLLLTFYGCSMQPSIISKIINKTEESPLPPQNNERSKNTNISNKLQSSKTFSRKIRPEDSSCPQLTSAETSGSGPIVTTDLNIKESSRAEVLLQGDGMSFDQEEKAVEFVEPVYDFPMVENDLVDFFLDYYSGQAKSTFKLWLERSARYLPMMQDIFSESGLPRDLAFLAMVESGFNDKAYSWAHAAGPWQFIESTGNRYGLKNTWWYDERRDPVKATMAAARYLNDLHDQFNGDWYLAIAGYNAGPGKIRRAIERYKTRDFWALTKGSYLRKETKHYVPKLLAVIQIAKQPEKYGFENLDYHAVFNYETTVLPTSTDIEVIARLAEVEYDQIKRLNPELKRWCTPPEAKNYTLRLPVGTKGDFELKYAVLPQSERANYVRHKLKKGDTLLALSKRFGVRVSDIKRLNQIRNPKALQVGTNLIIPLNPDYNRHAVAELQDDYKRSLRKFYTVQKGDSLWSISRKFSVTQKQLRVWNKLGWNNLIRPGQRLMVSSKAIPTKKGGKHVARSGPLQKMVYKVQPGDTLWGIGRQFAVETHQIRDWNNLSHNHVLKPGEHLTLMVRDQSSG